MTLQLKNQKSFEDLTDHMNRAFKGSGGKDALDRFATATLKISIYDEFKDSGTTQYIVSFLTLAEKRGEMDVVVEELVVTRPGDAQLREFARRIYPKALERVSEADHNEARVQLTAAGLKDLQTLSSDPAVAKLIRDAHLDLQRISAKLKLLAAYKELHDALHRIQVPIFAEIRRNLRRFPADPLAVDELDSHAESLVRCASDAADVVVEFPDEDLVQIEASWSKDLTRATDAFRAAVAKKDASAARAAMIGLKVILRQQPPRLDGLLVREASSIPIEKLVEVLRAVAGRFDDTDERKRLEDAGYALVSLTAELEVQVKEHEAWQKVETRFWLTEEALSRDPPDLDELNALWPGLIEELAAIAQFAPGSWSSELDTRALAFTSICPIPATPPVDPGAQRAMDKYVERGRTQFYLVDKALKQRCLNVARLSQPLNRLVGNA